MQISVMKFGGAAMAQELQFSKVALLIEKKLKENFQVVVVVSAMGDLTNYLLNLAKNIHPNPPKRELDMLTSVGERISMSLLAMALDNRGIDAMSFTGSQSGILTTNAHTQAKIIEVRPERILKALLQKKVAIVAGFQGMSLEKEITTLGRNGSDSSAVFLAQALGVKKVEFYKNVPGIGEKNPHLYPKTKIHSKLSYDQALAILENEGEILHKDCLFFAKNHQIALQIHSIDSPEKIGTIIA